MSAEATVPAEEPRGDSLLAVLLAMAMFVLVVDTSLMNVSISDSRPIALQIALLIPLLAGGIGVVEGFRMTRIPDPEPSGAAETLLAG